MRASLKILCSYPPLVVSLGRSRDRCRNCLAMTCVALRLLVLEPNWNQSRADQDERMPALHRD
jgi:hypothetical protein